MMTQPAAEILTLLDQIAGADRGRQGAAFQTLCTATETRVGWADAVWGDLVALLDHANNRTRAIAGQMLSRLAPFADPGTVAGTLPRLVAATRDAQFVTGRHILQSLARVADACDPVPTLLVDLLAARFRDCAAEKNASLIRFDIQTVLRAVHDRTDDDGIRLRALDLAMLEADVKYRKKYIGCWR